MPDAYSKIAASQADLSDLVGRESFTTWRVIDQEAVNTYATASGDGEGEWIHLDPERAAREAPYGGTIVPGFLQVANLTRLFGEAVTGFAGIDPNHALNYGFDRLRFVAPLIAEWLFYISQKAFQAPDAARPQI